MKISTLTQFICFILLCMNSTTGNAAGSANISYNITFPEAQAHYADVEMNITGLQQKTLVLKMPVWTPGSYLVREFERHVQDFAATDASGQRAEPIALDAAEMNEDVLAFGVHDEPETLLRIEPLDGTNRHGRPPTNARHVDLTGPRTTPSNRAWRRLGG